MTMHQTNTKAAEAATPDSAEEPGAGSPGDQAASGFATEAGQQAPEALDPAAAVASDVERLEAEKADLTDRLLRLAAEMDNLRRRTERDVTDARKYAVQRFAGDMLVVGDNLKRALEAIPAERRQAGDEAFGALVEGVEMTRREMDRLLQRHGVARIAAEGERFDPNRHQAMFEVPDPGVPAGTVVQVVQEGYSIGDRVLRAAMVGVSRGGAAPAAVEKPAVAGETPG